MERSEVAACCYWNLHKSCLPIALTPFPRYQFYSVYTGWPQNVVHFQHTISSKPFKIKWYKFYQNVLSVLGYNKTKAKLRRILNSYVKTTTQPLFPETSGTFRWNLFYFILNGSKDMVCWKVYNFFLATLNNLTQLPVTLRCPSVSIRSYDSWHDRHCRPYALRFVCI